MNLDEQGSNGNAPIGIEQRMGFVWVTLPDNIGEYAYAAVEDEIMRRVTGSGVHVVLDLSRLKAIYSTGLGILVRLRRRIGERGGEVSLVNVPRNIIELFSTLNLDRVFPLYRTEVEFEISHDDAWNRNLSEQRIDFVFVAQVERGIYRLAFTGEMMADHDLAACTEFTPDPGILTFVFDLTGLESIDSHGAGVFMQLLDRLVKQKGVCRAFGARKEVKQVLQFLGAGQYLKFYKRENDASGNDAVAGTAAVR